MMMNACLGSRDRETMRRALLSSLRDVLRDEVNSGLDAPLVQHHHHHRHHQQGQQNLEQQRQSLLMAASGRLLEPTSVVASQVASPVAQVGPSGSEEPQPHRPAIPPPQQLTLARQISRGLLSSSCAPPPAAAAAAAALVPSALAAAGDDNCLLQSAAAVAAAAEAEAAHATKATLLERAAAHALMIQRRIEQERRELIIRKSYLNLVANAQQMRNTTTPMLPMTSSQLLHQPETVTPPPATNPAVLPSTISQAKSTSSKTLVESLGSCLRNKADPYIDVAPIVKDSSSQEGDAVRPRRPRGGVLEPFPEKLHAMLSDADADEDVSGIVSWFSHGRAFGVHDVDKFVGRIMPEYFKRQTKWTSFARQLHLYGFVRITSGPDAGGYYHELFLRGFPDLVHHMKRVGVPQVSRHGDRRRKRNTNKDDNNNNDSGSCAATTAPNFYAMNKLEAPANVHQHSPRGGCT